MITKPLLLNFNERRKLCNDANKVFIKEVKHDDITSQLQGVATSTRKIRRLLWAAFCQAQFQVQVQVR